VDDPSARQPPPPVPERRPTRLEAHGDVRIDEWYWLADPSDPAVIRHLESENAYAEAVLAPLEPLRREIYDEMVARIEETDLSVPVRWGPWWYYQRTEEKRNYPVHCRRPARPGQDPPSGTSPSEDEQVLLDENVEAGSSEYFAVGNLAVCPDHRWMAYATDTTGDERYELRFLRLAGESGPPCDEVVADTSYGLAWANDCSTVFYTRVDHAMRPYQLWRHRVGTDPADDRLVMEEPDERFTLSVGRTRDAAFIVVALQSHTTSEQWVVPAGLPATEPRLVAARRTGVEYALEHLAPRWFVILTNTGAPDFRLVSAPDDAPSPENWREVLPHRPGTRIEDVDAFAGHLVVAERLDAEARLRVIPISGGDDDPLAGELLDRSWLVPVPEHPSTTDMGPNPEKDATAVRYQQTSLVSPRAVYDLDVADRRPVLRKRQAVLGGYDPGAYRTYRLWADAGDGVGVPISVVHRVDLSPGPAPCVLTGYGAYEYSLDPTFSSLRLSLLDRGFVLAIAHVRGGGELGRRWYEDGRLGHKPHTFSDFVACARHLVSVGLTEPALLAARGGSAGGLLIGAAVNQAPELFRAVVAEVPFVDCLTTMLDPSLPLTVGEWDEWGDPVTDADAYAVIRSYSPYDNVRSRDGTGAPVSHPRIFATAGLHDPRVGYWEPAKWVARLRDAGAHAVLRTELTAGHGGPSGRYDSWRDEALVYAFLIDALTGARPAGTSA
jgi:oligopeptidase B